MKKRMIGMASLLLAAVFLLTAWVLPASATEEETSPDAAAMATETISPLPGASIRVGENADESGIRFGFAVNKAWLASLSGEVTVGALIIPTDLLPIDLEASAAADFEGLLNIPVTGNWHPESTETTNVFYAAIVSLLGQNYARAFTAVGYVKTEDGITFSEASDSRSVYEVAKLMRASEGWATQAAAVQGRVTEYLNSVVELTSSVNVTSGFLDLAEAEGYSGPYTIAHQEGKLTIQCDEGNSVNNIRSILIDSDVYTGGWATNNEGNTLSVDFGGYCLVEDRIVGGSNQTLFTAGNPTVWEQVYNRDVTGWVLAEISLGCASNKYRGFPRDVEILCRNTATDESVKLAHIYNLNVRELSDNGTLIGSMKFFTGNESLTYVYQFCIAYNTTSGKVRYYAPATDGAGNYIPDTYTFLGECTIENMPKSVDQLIVFKVVNDPKTAYGRADNNFFCVWDSSKNAVQWKAYNAASTTSTLYFKTTYYSGLSAPLNLAD